MSKVVFHPQSHFEAARQPYRFLPFRYMDLVGRKLVVNEVGEHLLIDGATFDAFVTKKLQPNTVAYDDLKAKHILLDGPPDVPIKMLATKYRTKRSFLAGFTRLHLFVVTLRCEHSCHYCQVSRVSPDKARYDMTRETAARSLDLAFRSPARQISIEFQGGEPLLNFDVIRFVVEEARRRIETAPREIQFVITTNLALVTDDILEFCQNHKVLISTSLDGPALVHNANRPRPGNNSHELTVRGIERARSILGYDQVSALMTTTKLSLEHPESIVDEYVRLGFDHVVLRPLSPYGFAVKTKLKTGYDTDAYLIFYKRALARVIELNREGRFLIEGFAQLLLTKILTPFSTGYVDLQSPTGAGISAVVYNYDGDVYVSDEARMLAEMGDKTFKMGSVHSDTYEDMFGGSLLRSLVEASCVESLPGCTDCALHTWCGADPVENYAKQGNIFGHRPTSDFCHRNMSIIKHILGLYHEGDEGLRRILWSWVNNKPAAQLVPTGGTIA
jgi:His-Xaa-Ser system radical SAM maturase HxsB